MKLSLAEKEIVSLKMQLEDTKAHAKQYRIMSETMENTVRESSEINEKTKSSIGTATACITESLQRHELPKWRIKKINKLCNQFFHLSKAAKLTLDR